MRTEASRNLLRREFARALDQLAASMRLAVRPFLVGGSSNDPESTFDAVSHQASDAITPRISAALRFGSLEHLQRIGWLSRSVSAAGLYSIEQRRLDDLASLCEVFAQAVTSGEDPSYPRGRLIDLYDSLISYMDPDQLARVQAELGLRYHYDVCLSYAREDGEYVQAVADVLLRENASVFFDREEEGEIWGKELSEHFDWVYREASRYCVMFISSHYARKPWTRVERRSALARAVFEENEYILPVRFDATELPGLPPTVAYLDLSKLSPESLAEYIMAKLSTPR